MIGAPLLKDGVPVGALIVAWLDPGETPKRQQDLLKTFADQAVIAIENVRLINETKEALERQTATAEILRVISGSITNTQPVFDAIVRSCQRLFNGRAVGLVMPRAEKLVSRGVRERRQRQGRRWRPRAVAVRRRQRRRRVHSRVAHDRGGRHGRRRETFARMRELAPALGYRSGLFVPLLREGTAIGCIAIMRPTTGAVRRQGGGARKTFADQAVIAIENVRLFNETKEALERQTATAEILRVISGSITDTQPVFDAIVRNCQRLFSGRGGRARGCRTGDAAIGGVRKRGRRQGATAKPTHGRWTGTVAAGACILDSRVVAVPDIAKAVHAYPRMQELALPLGYRSALFVPLMREGKAIACLAILRSSVGAFSDKEISLARPSPTRP